MAVTISELGSLFCGIATSVSFLLLGRAVGGAGILSLFHRITRLKDRQLHIVFFGCVFWIVGYAYFRGTFLPFRWRLGCESDDQGSPTFISFNEE